MRHRTLRNRRRRRYRKEAAERGTLTRFLKMPESRAVCKPVDPAMPINVSSHVEMRSFVSRAPDITPEQVAFYARFGHLESFGWTAFSDVFGRKR